MWDGNLFGFENLFFCWTIVWFDRSIENRNYEPGFILYKEEEELIFYLNFLGVFGLIESPYTHAFIFIISTFQFLLVSKTLSYGKIFRFDPFIVEHEQGGLSFSIALIEGVVEALGIVVLFARIGVNILAGHIFQEAGWMFLGGIFPNMLFVYTEICTVLLQINVFITLLKHFQRDY